MKKKILTNHYHIIIFILSSRVFGHFEKPLFFELCKHILTKSLPKGKILFKPGPVSVNSIFILSFPFLIIILLSTISLYSTKLLGGEGDVGVWNNRGLKNFPNTDDTKFYFWCQCNKESTMNTVKQNLM